MVNQKVFITEKAYVVCGVNYRQVMIEILTNLQLVMNFNWAKSFNRNNSLNNIFQTKNKSISHWNRILWEENMQKFVDINMMT